MGFYEYMISDLTFAGAILGIPILVTLILLPFIAAEDSEVKRRQKIKQQLDIEERIQQIAKYDFENPDNTLSTHEILRKHFSEESITPEVLETFIYYYTLFLTFELQEHNQAKEIEDTVEEPVSEEELTVTFEPEAQRSIDKIEAIRQSRLQSIQQHEETMQNARSNIT